MFYLINKRKGISSFKAIREFANENNIKKVGHTGTLDPLATGLLLIASDDDTKLINYIDKGSKSYIATMKLGYNSDTLDVDGEVIKVNEQWNPSEVNEAIKSFIGEYDQVPPIFSAKKINGKRAYSMARNGEEVKMTPNKVSIESIKNINIIDDETLSFEVVVSRGTYIRSLIRDIGNKLGTKAIMSELIRNKVSGFDISEAPRNINAKELIKLPIVCFENIDDLIRGKEVKINSIDGDFAVEFKGEIIGIISVLNNKISKRKLFGNKIERLKNESN